MNKTNEKNDKSTWAIGGTTLIGIGVGFIFLKESALLFIASILIGIGVGMVITAIISREKKIERLKGHLDGTKWASMIGSLPVRNTGKNTMFAARSLWSPSDKSENLVLLNEHI